MNKKNYLIAVFGIWISVLLPAELLAANTATSALPPPIGKDTVIYDTMSIAAGLFISRCIDTTGLTGPVDTFYNACSGNYSPTVSFVLDYQNRCVKYQALSCGTDTACITVCDAFGVCNTMTLVVSAFDPGCFPATSYIYDTIFVHTSDDVCFDQRELPGRAISIQNFCPGASGDQVVFTIDPATYCLYYSAIAVGTDTACIVVRDDRGFTDTTCVIVTGKIPSSTTICDTLKLGESSIYCIANDELEGQIVGFDNACPQASGVSVLFNLNPGTLCAEAVTLSVGVDSACLVICDENDVCDTTFVKIVVLPADTVAILPPIAVNDTTQTPKNTPVGITILANDTIPETPILVTVIAQPEKGIALVGQDFSVLYIPNVNFCGLDSFIYRVCNVAGCDTATVYINVDCRVDTLIIYNGISPDGDGTNDNFTILGIENYPNNQVWIHNRWGNEVFRATGYRNTWDGRWEGKALPDGTYFYLIDLGNGTRHSGFLQIHR